MRAPNPQEHTCSESLHYLKTQHAIACSSLNKSFSNGEYISLALWDIDEKLVWHLSQTSCFPALSSCYAGHTPPHAGMTFIFNRQTGQWSSHFITEKQKFIPQDCEIFLQLNIWCKIVSILIYVLINMYKCTTFILQNIYNICSITQ